MNRTPVDVDFKFSDIVVGADIDAVRLASDKKYLLIRNREPYHHSYEGLEEEWAQKVYGLYDQGLAPFADKVKSLRIDHEERLIKVFLRDAVFVVQYKNLHILDLENVHGSNLERQLVHYRVVDWFDCQGLHSLETKTVETGDKFVQTVGFFKSRRIDGNQKYLDLYCESFLTEDQLKSFDYSDTMARFKVADLLKNLTTKEVDLRLWKRDVYPIYQTI
tara:strand:+ start:249 stop:905 length:657 start_codon:yes stop_codon:yes gene_type:complete